MKINLMKLILAVLLMASGCSAYGDGFCKEYVVVNNSTWEASCVTVCLKGIREKEARDGKKNKVYKLSYYVSDSGDEGTLELSDLPGNELVSKGNYTSTKGGGAGEVTLNTDDRTHKKQGFWEGKDGDEKKVSGFIFEKKTWEEMNSKH